MKNIFILDCSGDEIFKTFFNSFFKPIACIVLTDEEKEFCIQNGVKYCFTLKEVDFLVDLNCFDFQLIEDFRATQRKIEFGMMRILNSNMLIVNKFYNALCVFKKIFDTNDIECIFVNGLPHGYIPETILLDFGKKNQIATYHIFPITSSYSSIVKYNERRNILVTEPISPTDITLMAFNKDKNSYHLSKINKRLSFSQKIIHYIGGQILIDILSSIKRFNSRVSMGFYKIRLIEKIYSYYRLYEMKKFYNKNSISPNYSCNYVFFALHFEPEAATGVVCDLQNQLTIIQILSQSLPKDWVLYIKDHPHQYDINNNFDHYYIPNIQYFKDIDFYKEVLKFKNVKLINLNISSKDLSTNAKVIATINGSIILESILMKKPIITFDNHLMPITQLKYFKNIYVFKNFKELVEYFVMEKWKITLTDYEVQQGIQILSGYYFNSSNGSCIVKSIIMDMQSHFKPQ